MQSMSQPSTRLEVIADGPNLVVRGEIDAHVAATLAGHLDPLPGADGDVRVDVSGVDFVDSSGLRVFIDAHQRARAADRRLVIVQPSRAVSRLLEISGLADHLDVEAVDTI
jgi:anti-sigma B factor antagonist